jgi:rhodanese-related sulfurtransferase
MTGLSLVRNPRFLGDLQRHVKKTDVILLLCRSGKRSAAAADALTKAGFSQVFNVAEGFEGDIDANRRRGSRGGWRSYDLPWVQD